jgi:leucyl/phenylalanyl-tRNA--protein transferase
MIFELGEHIFFPPPEYSEPDGLLAVGGDLNIDRLILAYSQGIFPWFNPEDPILWWSPDPRPVVVPGKMRVTKNLARLIRRKKFTVTFDREFETVINRCADTFRPGQPGTWLTPQMKEAYINLHNHGYCHSVEVWLDGKLAGGLYGVALGKAFFGESMFHAVTDASKVAFYHLSEYLAAKGFHLIDGQVSTPHLLSLGAVEIPRDKFLIMLREALKFPTDARKWGE